MRMACDYVLHVLDQEVCLARSGSCIDFRVLSQLLCSENITRSYFNSHSKPSLMYFGTVRLSVSVAFVKMSSATSPLQLLA